PASTRSMIIASSSSGRRPREFWLSPSRSNTAQAIPCTSMEKRQSRNALISIMALYLAGTLLASRRRRARRRGPCISLGGALHRPRVVAGHHVVRLDLGRIEVVDGDHALGEPLHLGQQLGLRIRDDP